MKSTYMAVTNYTATWVQIGLTDYDYLYPFLKGWSDSRDFIGIPTGTLLKMKRKDAKANEILNRIKENVNKKSDVVTISFHHPYFEEKKEVHE